MLLRSVLLTWEAPHPTIGLLLNVFFLIFHSYCKSHLLQEAPFPVPRSRPRRCLPGALL